MVKNRRWNHFLSKVFNAGLHLSMGSAVAIVLALMIVIVIHSIGRYLFSQSLLWIMEACAYGFMAVVFLALGPTQKANRHVKVDVLEERLPPRISQFMQGIVTPVISLVYVIYFIWASGILTLRYLKNGAVGLDLDFMPLALPAAMIPIGLISFSIVLIAKIINYVIVWHRSGKEASNNTEAKLKSSL